MDDNIQQQPPIDAVAKPPVLHRTLHTWVSLLALVILAVIVSGLSYFMLGRELTVEQSVEVVVQHKEQKLAETVVTTPVQFNAADITSRVPAQWGKLLEATDWIEKGEKISNIHSLKFANKFSGVYQDGTDYVVFSEIKIEGACGDVHKEYFVIDASYDYASADYDDTKCNFVQRGLYNLKTKKILYLKPDDEIYQMLAVFPSTFAYIDDRGARHTTLFSPKQTFFAQGFGIYEGCGINFVDTTTAKTIENQRIENGFIDFSFSCGLVLNFSADESVFVVRVNWAGMASSRTQFAVIKGSEQLEILPKLIEGKFDDTESDVDVVADIMVTSVTDSEVAFTILKDRSFYKKGLYIFNIDNNKLIKK